MNQVQAFAVKIHAEVAETTSSSSTFTVPIPSESEKKTHPSLVMPCFWDQSPVFRVEVLGL